jgi:methionyl-tRNA formyltransferase
MTAHDPGLTLYHPAAPAWWQSPRKVYIVCPADSWMIGHARHLYDCLLGDGDAPTMHTHHDQIGSDGIAVFLSYPHIVPADALKRNHKNLVVHASDLPCGRGWSPWVWDVLRGADTLTVCLIEAAEPVDTGDVLLRRRIRLEGTELLPELRALVGQASVDLCNEWLNAGAPRAGEKQRGPSSYWSRRTPAHSKLDPLLPLAEQFDLLRVCDNDAYPAWFEWRGARYRLKVERVG